MSAKEIYGGIQLVENGHVFRVDKDLYDSDKLKDNIDTFALEYEIHNGPMCIKCDKYFCHHCEPQCYTETCPLSPQLELIE